MLSDCYFLSTYTLKLGWTATTFCINFSIARRRLIKLIRKFLSETQLCTFQERCFLHEQTTTALCVQVVEPATVLAEPMKPIISCDLAIINLRKWLRLTVSNVYDNVIYWITNFTYSLKLKNNIDVTLYSMFTVQ